MYEWLTDALRGDSTVITANRRLARVLQEEYARQQVHAGKIAWRSPAVRSWQDWLEGMLLGATDQSRLPTRINPWQSQLLWERCLNKELGGRNSGLAGLVRLSRGTWQRLADWRVTIKEVAGSAENDDQRLFAAAAGRYLGILEREHWVDDAGMAALIDESVREGRTTAANCLTFAGFDRESPSVAAIKATLAESGCHVASAPSPASTGRAVLQCFESPDSELRAAGAWARQLLEKQPEQTIAIVADDLERQADHKAHLVREGLVPGWQYASPPVAHALNVSYGRKLIDYPAVGVALLFLRWLVEDLSAGEIGHLLRTPLFGPPETGGRSRLELRLRTLPDRNWSPANLGSAFRGREESADAKWWLTLIAGVTKLRRELDARASPADWAVFIDATLKTCEWPGEDALGSVDFQLVNRWRDLLNDLAKLELVSSTMTLKSAIQRLEIMAAETVFQPEADPTAVQLMGPLEAAGAQFDAVWISGLTAARWPPAGNPSPLLSRRLQRQKGMPDAEPADTVNYARNRLLHLGAAARTVVCSYAISEEDAEQTPSALLHALGVRTAATQQDPGWHARRLSKIRHTVGAADPVPGICRGERVAGGAGTLQRQLTDPIAAFVVGRLGVKSLQPQAIGLPASLRGNIVHEALHNLYFDKPSRDGITAWPEDELVARIQKATNAACGRHERYADGVLVEMLKLERQRIGRLLRHFVTVDTKRDDFSVECIEEEISFSEAGIYLPLRVDRIDRLPDGTLAILDYKTGAKKKFLRSDGQPRELQLVVYAAAVDGPVSALAVVNIDSRDVGFDGVGQGYTNEADWHDALTAWKREVSRACEQLSDGDVRINAAQSVKEARYLNLLSRYTELRRDV